jgi:FAD/FMN-containing dehydrogenase
VTEVSLLLQPADFAGDRLNEHIDESIQIQWVRDFADAMQPYASEGFYPNYEANVGPERLVAAFEPEKYNRLAAVKRKYDPSNIFRLNQNIIAR